MVRITKEAVAREARLSPATLYRLPDVVEAIAKMAGTQPKSHASNSSAQRRKALLDRIADLERRNDQLLSENLRLTRLLSVHDPLLGKSQITDLGTERIRRRTTVSTAKRG